MDLNKIKQKLSALETPKGGGSKWRWTPTPGKHIIRMLPYLHNKDWPFVELFFYYKLKNQTILSPISFGKPDPVQEFVDTLKATGEKEDWKTAVSMQAKPRTYIPILVRGKEEEGVKFWGFGKQIYQELLKVIDDPDYGDISHPKNGRDITVEVIKTEKPWPDIMIRVKPDKTEMTSKKEVLDLIKEMPDVNTLWPEPTYDELKKMLENFLNNSEEAEDKDTPADGATSKSVFDEDVSYDDIPEVKPTKKQPIKASTTVDDSDFEDLFK